MGNKILENSKAKISLGKQAYLHGNFEKAVSRWLEAVEILEKDNHNDKDKLIILLIQLANAYQALGQYPESIKVLNKAYSFTQLTKNPRLVPGIFNSLGSVYTTTGQYSQADKYLRETISMARQLASPHLLAAALNNYGNFFSRQNEHSKALDYYFESSKLAHTTNNHQLAAKANLNAATSALKLRDFDKTQKRLLAGQKELESVKNHYDKAFLLISAAQIAYKISKNQQSNTSFWESAAYHAYQRAIEIAAELNDPRIFSYATGYLGQLYFDHKRHNEALKLTQQAIFLIEKIQVPEILFRWQWQKGRILKTKGELSAAITSYQQAIETLETVRPDLLSRQQDTRLFRKEIGSLYLELADLLLHTSEIIQDSSKLQSILISARNTMEQLKAAELHNYFKNDCISILQEKLRTLETLNLSRTAVIYPIILPDRTEILLSLADGGIKRFTVTATQHEITKEVRLFRQTLENRTTREYLLHAQRLYQWFILPLKATLEQFHVGTLVMVPDESLRTIPMAAFHDGHKFLIEKYAIANSPGLTLLEPQPISPQNTKLLAIGLSEATQGFSALPYVKTEIININKIFSGKALLNNEFLYKNVRNELMNTEFNIVHIASHGQFKSNAQDSFVLSFDEKINMNKLEQLLGLSQFRKNPIELLTLSACQTAAGDDLAALGLAGIAIKAGARSAVATLWLINDKAASDLISEFYRQLYHSEVSKAQALRNAQLLLLKKTAFQHPYFWSPFQLFGNWL